MRLSPFSIAHEWVLHWVQPSSYKKERWIEPSKKEYRALKAIAAIGAIGGAQLLHGFLNGDRKRLKRMVATGKIIRHELRRDKQIVPFYTLGPLGEQMFNCRVEKMDIETVLRKMIFFLLHEKLDGGICSYERPYEGMLLKGKLEFRIIILRGNEQEINRYFKWAQPQERIILVAESVHHLHNFKENLKGIKIRATTDEWLLEEKPMFFRWENGWIEDRVQNKAAVAK